MEEAPPTKSDAATRKRRSSILKSQRASRTPFSDLEFNVATPTDTAKSRRVSFSRRTGVAEFATNEATTTWKNFYEEHNKSLESSGNDSVANGTRQIASLGRRSFFDKQFQEVEGVDFIETLNPRNPNFNTSVSHINFPNQLSGLDCTEGDKNLEAPEHFDFGSITNHQTNVFEDDIGIAIMGEVSGRIDLNFSMVQTIGSKDKDDLEQLKKDIQQGSSNRNCPTSSQDGKDLSEYIEFDLDVTRGPIQDVSDMSITDTILSPKVQNVSKNNSVLQKSQGNADWVADKENIVLNPYTAPREADNFAINEESDKVLVFDGKKLTVQKTNTSTIENVVKEPQRKTIVLNMHDDLPNFVDEFSVAKQLAHKFDNNEKSVNDISNISISQSVPTNIITEQVYEKRKTILFNDGHISVTQSLPAQVLIPEEFNVYDEKTNKTISNEDCDISMTQAVVKNVILTQGTVKSKRNTILFGNNSGDISMTQVLPANLIYEAPTSDDGKTGRRKTIVYDENSGDISCTQVIPTNIIVQQPNLESTSNNSDKTIMKSCLLEETLIGNIKNQPKDSENAQSTKRKTIVFYDDAADISVTQAIPTNILNAKDAENLGRRKTIVYDESSGDISCTQVIPTNIILPELNRKSTTINIDQTNLENDVLEQLLIENKINNFTDPNSLKLDKENNQSSKRRTIVFEDDAADISVTQAIPTNILNTENVENAGQRKTNVYDEASGDISCTQVISPHIILPPTNNLNTENVENAGRRKTIVFDEASGDISCTQVIPSHIILPTTNNLNTENAENAGRRKTIVYDEASGDISCTQVIPSHIILPPMNMDTNTNNTQISKSYVLEETSIGKPNEKENEQSSKRKTIVFEDEFAKISVTQAIPTNIFTAKSTIRKTILFDQDVGDMSVTQAILTNLISNKSLDATTVAHCQDVNKSHISALGMSLRIKPKSLDVQEIQMETEKETDDSFMNINKSVHSVSLQKEDFSKTQDVLDQISAIIDCSDAKQPTENSENLNETKNLPSKSIRMISNSTLDQEPKSDVIINKTSQNTSIYNRSINLENISSKKISLSQENAVDPHNVISKSDVIQLVSVSQSCEENPVLTSAENIQKISSAYATSKTSTSLISANIKTDLTMTSLYKKKSMLNELLDMSNDSMDYIPKSINKSKNISQSVKSYIDIGDDSFDIDKEATELPKDTSTTDKDNIILIPGEDIVSVIKEQDNVIIPKLEKPDPLETEDFIGFKPESTEEQVTVNRRPDVVNVTENEIISLDNTYKKAQEISVLDMHNDVTKKDPLSKSKENNIADGSLANKRDCTDEVKDEKMDLNSNASKVQSVTMDEKSAMDIVVEEKRPSYAPRLSRITREDFLNNLSMAQQILQNTNLDLDTSMNDDSTECSIEEMDDTDEFVEANRTNNEVVKKLDFEDDSSEFENKSDVSSSLHKPSKSQLAQDLESKSIVIPPYSSQDPMNDLVELTADSMLIERNENISEYAPRISTIPEREDSMCSDHIQANLVSQIDVKTEICFDSESLNNVPKVTQSKNKSVSLASAVKIFEDSENDVTGMNESLDNKQPIRQESPKIIRPDSRTDFSEANTIVIENDKNPLSKVSLSPLHDKELSFKNESYVLKMPENDQVSMQCEFISFTDSKDRLQSRNAAEIFSTKSKICSLETVTVAKPQLCEMKDTMVNTILVNKDFSKTSASISVDDVQSCGNSNDMVIDDVLDDMESQKSVVNSKAKKRFYSPRTKNSCGVDKSSPNQSSKMIKISNSPHTTNAEKIKSKDSESAIFSSADICVLETSAQDNNYSNAEIIGTSQNNSSSFATKTKRVYHSSFRKSRHNSVGANSVSYPVTSPEANDAIDVDMILKNKSDLASPISRTKENKNVECPNEENAIKTGTNMTAQNVSTDCIRQNDVLEPHTLVESSEKTVETKNDKAVGDKSIRANTSDTIRSRTKISSSEVASDDLKCTVLSENKEPIALARKRIVKSKARDDGALNVVPQIEKLPDIGSRKFSWEAHNDAWSFSLLYGRLRLCVRLQRNSDNEPRSYVRADTPIEEVNLDIPYQDTSNSISSTCANFTANTIRHIISHGTWDYASSVPNLLKKCLERVRVGFNWARALHEAWYTMAYKLHDDNKLSVNVANVPLSSVWNVTMRFELVVPEDGEVPWPKAVDVVVHEVVSDVKITKSQIADLLDGLPKDWSHVPRALWKVYDYLGNLKKREEMEWQAVFKHIHKTRV